ncbi:MAG: glycolate oxidase binding subunit [Acidimicrobiaceae bacterium]
MSLGANALQAFAEEIGADDPVVAVGGRTQFDVGGRVDSGAREVRPPIGIVEHVAAEMTVRVRAGTTVAELDAALGAHRQCVALPSWEGATIGGVLAVGHSGLRRLAWGPVRDALLEVRYVSAEGHLVKGGGPTVKNVSGYDLPRLFVGSLGTLGVIAEVVLRTRPLAAREQWFTSDEVDPFELARRLYRACSVLWDGTTTWVLLEGHPRDVDEQGRSARLRAIDAASLPPLPKQRWSLAPAALRSLHEDGNGPFVAEVGVGVVHRTVPQPPRATDPTVAALASSVKHAFDPTGRLAPGRMR